MPARRFLFSPANLFGIKELEDLVPCRKGLRSEYYRFMQC